MQVQHFFDPETSTLTYIACDETTGDAVIIDPVLDLEPHAWRTSSRSCDLVREYVRLCRSDEPFARMPHGRYVNFVSDFYAHRPAATRDEITAAWHELKSMDCPKTFRDWRTRKTARSSRR